MLKKIREKDEYIIFGDENGNTAEFEFLEMYITDGKEYAVLLQKGDDMVTVMRYEEQKNDELYYDVDEETAEKVFLLFREDFSDEFGFE